MGNRFLISNFLEEIKGVKSFINRPIKMESKFKWSVWSDLSSQAGIKWSSNSTRYISDNNGI